MITFYHASGSPFARRVWLALEHKELPYEEKLLSFAAGDLKKPEYLAINPRHKVPARRFVQDHPVELEMTARW